ncbi:DUF2304 domain-containing protein [Arthrobacter yangruifuii]|uniref:DUF2304 domain-containing protein n=1 Tax=Arthrobacter yangruifuii TaxID=2606616 RepID=UPI0011B66349|nr:DUF2304 domain-containing protein [Arthrobacter yangruifuii]
MPVFAGLLVVVAILVFILEMLRKRRLREKYAALWMIIGLALLLLAAFPQLLFWAAALLGVQVPSNLLFAMALLLLMCVCLHLSYEQSQSEDELRILAEEVAILKTRIRELGEGIEAPGRGEV